MKSERDNMKCRGQDRLLMQALGFIGSLSPCLSLEFLSVYTNSFGRVFAATVGCTTHNTLKAALKAPLITNSETLYTASMAGWDTSRISHEFEDVCSLLTNL